MMIFPINKNATLPLLVMELVQDGRNDYRKFHEKIQNATITFSMWDDCGIPVVFCAESFLLKKDICQEDCEEEYYIAYQWKNGDTEESGDFKGEFKIEFLDGSGTLIVPIREELIIKILDSRTK